MWNLTQMQNYFFHNKWPQPETCAKTYGNQHLLPVSSTAPTNGRHISQTHSMVTASTTCSFLWGRSPSSAFHTGTWTYSALHNTEHTPQEGCTACKHWVSNFCYLSYPRHCIPLIWTSLNNLIPVFPLQPICLLVDKGTSVPAPNVSHSPTFPAPPVPFLNLRH